MKLHQQLITTIIIASAVTSTQLTVAAENQAQATVEYTEMSEAELAQMLAPIALYPDTLLTHILIAATYPIEVIDADRFIKDNKYASNDTLQEIAENKDWDPSVKALLAFPQILEKLSTDLTWMRELGDAFLQDEAQVLASIQRLRQQADNAGNLAKMDNVKIIREQKTIVIQPEQPEIIYVPYYDTRRVYGHWHWSHRPPIYWHRPAYYSYHHGPFYWRSGVHLALDFFFVGFQWHKRYVVHHTPKYYRSYHSRKRVTTSHRVKRWQHNPNRRKGVAYRSHDVKKRYASHRPVRHYISSDTKQGIRKERTIDRHGQSYKKHHAVSKKLRNLHGEPMVEKRNKQQKRVTKGVSGRQIQRDHDKGILIKNGQRQHVKRTPKVEKQRHVEHKLKQYRQVNKPQKYSSATKTQGVRPQLNKRVSKPYDRPVKVRAMKPAKGGHSRSIKTYTRVAKGSNGHKPVAPSNRKIKPRHD
ncbi:DUF3300 domain-containing protein [Thalassotalea sediminis]|uniref:DUF3300 domain-containing protein n=1 Tax=Thalassotalea sediminis TaxID=1759089 RepID=UPI0025730B41|nr:DUF3300 domain-containing protein [Thalassotalea sediminis]